MIFLFKSANLELIEVLPVKEKTLLTKITKTGHSEVEPTLNLSEDVLQFHNQTYEIRDLFYYEYKMPIQERNGIYNFQLILVFVALNCNNKTQQLTLMRDRKEIRYIPR